MAARGQQRHQRRQYQRERDKGQVARNQFKQRRNAVACQGSLAAGSLCRHRAFLRGLATGQRNLDFFVTHIIAVVVVRHLAIARHPAIGVIGRCVVFFFRWRHRIGPFGLPGLLQ